jgi:hypothetical protein
MPQKTPSSWVHHLKEWMDDNGLELLNPAGEPMWHDGKPNTRPSVIDLTLANEAAMWIGQLSDLSISIGDSLGSDYAMLLLTFYFLSSIAMLPPPQPTGYKADKENRAEWIRAF